MELNNSLINALQRIPELIERNERILQDNEEKLKLLAELVVKRVEAEIPQEELQKVARVACEAVERTPTRMPATEELSDHVAKQAGRLFREAIQSATIPAVEEAIKNNPITVASPREYAKYIEPKVRRWAGAMTIVAGVCFLALIGFGILHAHSKIQLGRDYVEIALSKFTTDEESERLSKEIVPLSALPEEYDKGKKVVRQRIKRNKEIIAQREAEAKANKGKFSARIPLER